MNFQDLKAKAGPVLRCGPEAVHTAERMQESFMEVPLMLAEQGMDP